MKWAGGKGQIARALVERAPRAIDTYYEPFLGGGAMFFALAADSDRAPRSAVLNDANRELIATYGVVRDDVGALVERLGALAARYLAAGEAERARQYYEARRWTAANALETAARLIFLNKTCYNGLYRVNRRGEFNVPHGRYARPRILDREALLGASRALQGVELRCVDFAEACADAGDGDFVYFDPPFHPLSETSKFTSYTEGNFGRADQRRLRWAIDDLTERGAAAMLSNSPHDYVLGLYEGAGPGRYHIERLPARRAINSRGDRRGAIDELVVTNYEPSSN